VKSSNASSLARKQREKQEIACSSVSRKRACLLVSGEEIQGFSVHGHRKPVLQNDLERLEKFS
jgi:hypothetical protein